MKLGLNVFPKSSLNFFIDVVDKSVKERKTAADDEEVCVNSTSILFQCLIKELNSVLATFLLCYQLKSH